MLDNPGRIEFRALVRSGISVDRLARGALLIAAEEYPDLNIHKYSAEIADMGGRLRILLRPLLQYERKARALIDYLFMELGVSGNTVDFYNPKNSFLNDVIDERKGIPITMAILMIAIGREAGLDLQGISFPGHYLVKLMVDWDREIIIDPFFGQIVEKELCLARLRETTGVELAGEEELYLSPASGVETLARLLINLKQIYIAAGEYTKALSCSDRIAMLKPEDPFEIRDRGLLHQQLECFLAAQADYEQFLGMVPLDSSAQVIRSNLKFVREQIDKFN